MKLDGTTYRLTDTGNLGRIALITGLVFLAVSAIGYAQNPGRFFPAYLTAYVYWLTIALGGLFFTMLHHLTGARWSTVLRRLSESIAGTLPLMLVLFIPVILGLHDLFHWSHSEIYDPSSPAFDELLSKKEPYLNTTFFYIRAAIYFAVWIVLSGVLGRTSLRQDQRHSAGQMQNLRRVSAPGMVAFGLTLTFASFDWLMSLDAHWYSTIFGVYIFSGAFLAILSFMVLMGAYMRKSGVLADVITVEHYHDIGKLAFAFIIFWAYMAFSQYFLIWYANIPEENYWYLYRWDSSWKSVSLIIVFGHFVIPFLGLLTRAAKRSVGFLTSMAVWILIMHWVDLYWLVMPTHHQSGAHFSWMDVTTLLGVGGLFFWYFWKRYTARALVPVNDPNLAASIRFINA
ncbi:MAG: hypothetical protein JSW34_08930 [Candidatus Zixiibacteriota bacterium]|nr:MAG: hypothetical protein JSW34_08930 [candidate division Zixibacteria bacterium]